MGRSLRRRRGRRAGRRVVGMRRAQALERLPRHRASCDDGAMSMTFCHAAAAPSRSCLPNARTMPMFSSVFVCFAIDRQRAIELRQRPIRLVHVVVGDPEIRAGVDVLRVDRQRRPRTASLASGKRSASKYRLPSCDAGLDVCCGPSRSPPSACAARDSSNGARGLRLAGGRRRRAGAVAAAGGRPCWLPIIQPTRRPKNTPAMPKTTDSLDTERKS